MRSEAKRPQVDEAAPRWLTRLILRWKEIQDFSEGNPSRNGRNPNIPGRKSKLNASLSFAKSSLFKDLRRPPRHFGFEPSGRCGSVGVRVFAPGSSSVLLFVSGSSGLFRQVKGWRRFDRGWRPCETRRRRFRPTCRPRSLIAREGNQESTEHPRVMSPRTGIRKRQADRSDVRQEYIRFTKSPNRCRAAWTSGRAPALHAFRSISRPCL